MSWRAVAVSSNSHKSRFFTDFLAAVFQPRAFQPTSQLVPDRSFDAATTQDQALLYRPSGDRNPLHADPEFAKAVGFSAPILHGLCTYGTCCRAIITHVCDYDPRQITDFDVRFSSPVYPGETITLDIWKDGNVLSFRAYVKARDVMVINNGKCTLAG